MLGRPLAGPMCVPCARSASFLASLAVCCLPCQDYLYREELEAFAGSGALSQLHVAVSREGPSKVYVQHLMHQQVSARSRTSWGPHDRQQRHAARGKPLAGRELAWKGAVWGTCAVENCSDKLESGRLYFSL